MSVKTVEMVRKIRDKHYSETKNLSMEKQVDFVKKKAVQLQKKLRGRRSTVASRNLAI